MKKKSEISFSEVILLVILFKLKPTIEGLKGAIPVVTEIFKNIYSKKHSYELFRFMYEVNIMIKFGFFLISVRFSVYLIQQLFNSIP